MAVAASRETFFTECDVISLQLRLYPATRGIITAAAVFIKKPCALLVNTSTAPLIVPVALFAALVSRLPRCGVGGLSASAPRLDPAHPTLTKPNVIGTHPIIYVSTDATKLQVQTTC